MNIPNMVLVSKALVVPLLTLSHIWDLILPLFVYYAENVFENEQMSHFTSKINKCPTSLVKSDPGLTAFEQRVESDSIINDYSLTSLRILQWGHFSETLMDAKWCSGLAGLQASGTEPYGQRKDSMPVHWVEALAFVSIAPFQPIVTSSWCWRQHCL